MLLTAAVGGFCYINQNLRPVLRGLASARVEAIAARAMNDAIMEIVAEESGELIRVYENDTRVYLLQADAGNSTHWRPPVQTPRSSGSFRWAIRA